MTDILKPRDPADVEAAVQWALAEKKALEIVGQGSKRAIGRPAQHGYPRWLLPMLLLLLLVSAGLAVYLLTRERDEPQQVAKNEDQPPAPAPTPTRSPCGKPSSATSAMGRRS